MAEAFGLDLGLAKPGSLPIRSDEEPLSSIGRLAPGRGIEKFLVRCLAPIYLSDILELGLGVSAPCSLVPVKQSSDPASPKSPVEMIPWPTCRPCMNGFRMV